MIARAKLNYLRITPRKVRLVADLIREENVEKAQVTLRFLQKKAALPILKLLQQAIANAKQQYPDLEEKELYISKVLVNEGPAYRRLFPRARGKGDIVKKRTSHVTLVLDSLEEKIEKKKKKKASRKIKKDLEFKKEVKSPTKKPKKKRDFRVPKKKNIKPKREKGGRTLYRRKTI